MAERRVNFTGVDNGVSNMMNRLREDSKQLTNELIRDAQSYSTTSRQQLQYIEEQIRAIERRNRIEAQGQRIILERQREAGTITPDQYQQQVSQIGTINRTDELQVSLLRELIEAVRSTSRDEIREDRKGVQDRVREFQRREARGDLSTYSDEELFKLRYQQEILGMAPGDRTGQQGGMSVFGGVVAANLLNRLGGLAQQVPRAQTQLDLVGPAIGIGASAIGAGIGTGFDLTTLGQTEFQIIGAELGSQIGQFYSEALVRSLTSREALSEASLRLRAITGDGRTFTTAAGLGRENLGFDAIQQTELAARVVNLVGTRTGMAGRAYDFQAIQRAFGFDEGLVARRFALERMGQRNTTLEIARILQAAEQLGFFPTTISGDVRDQTTFIDLIRNQTALIEQFAQTATVVDPNQALRTILEFDRVGGMFRTTDPRSMQLISSINQGLAAPQNDFMQAANFQVLRRLSPEAGLFDLLRMQQQGLQTPGFLRGVIGDITQMGGGEDFQRLMLAQRLPGVPLDAISDLFDRRGRIGEISDEELASIVGDEGALRDRAARNVPRLARDRAEITNAFIQGSIDGINTVAAKFGDEISRALEGAGDELKKKMNEAGTELVDEFSRGLNDLMKPAGIGVTDSTTVTNNHRAKMMGEK